MTNGEYFEDIILAYYGIKKGDNLWLKHCNEMRCEDCLFNEAEDCGEAMGKWWGEKYTESEEQA